MKLYIKNMVCGRCMKAVEQVFQGIDVKPLYIHLGEVVLQEPLSPEQLNTVGIQLKQLGFELLDDKRKKIIEQIKTLIIQNVHYNKEPSAKNYSILISESLRHDYSYLSKLFSETEGITIEQFIINQKIEKVKELLVYDEKNLSEIAYETGYSSVAHLSAQFKKVTGQTPSAFKQSGIHHRKTLDFVKSKNPADNKF